MKVPSRLKAEALLAEAEVLNPGPWVQHSKYVAQAAQAIAERLPALEPEVAYSLGCLHDIGRRAGVTEMRHAIDGYLYMSGLGFKDAARICLTHSFPIPQVASVVGKWDCSPDELEFVGAYLSQIEFTRYDRLIQLCDALALPTGFCLIEKRMIDVALRYGVNEYTVPRWKARFQIQRGFEDAIGGSIYDLLPGVVENTFDYSC